MDLTLTLRVAMRALAKNKMRAGLTILGVVIGIAAVTTMVSIGQSASGLVQGQFEMLGTNVILVFPSALYRDGSSSGPRGDLDRGRQRCNQRGVRIGACRVAACG